MNARENQGVYADKGFSMLQVVMKKIGIEVLTDLVDQSQEQARIDTGSTLVSTHIHPQFGALTLVASAMDSEGVVFVSAEHAEKIAA